MVFFFLFRLVTFVLVCLDWLFLSIGVILGYLLIGFMFVLSTVFWLGLRMLSLDSENICARGPLFKVWSVYFVPSIVMLRCSWCRVQWITVGRDWFRTCSRYWFCWSDANVHFRCHCRRFLPVFGHLWLLLDSSVRALIVAAVPSITTGVTVCKVWNRLTVLLVFALCPGCCLCN